MLIGVRKQQIRVIIKKRFFTRTIRYAARANALAFFGLGIVGKPCDVVAACLTVGRLGDGRSNKVRVTMLHCMEFRRNSESV